LSAMPNLYCERAASVAQPFSVAPATHTSNQAGDLELDRRPHFFGEETTVRRACLRLLAHACEHMGQMIAFLRFNGIEPRRSDWSPDRPT
jgi:hypothetical protein